MTKGRLVVAAAVAIVLGLGLGLGFGLSGGSSPAGRANDHQGGGPGSGGGTSGTSTSTTSPAEALAAVAGLPDCTLGELSVNLGPAQEVAGHSGMPVVFRNTSSSACALRGYPTVTGFTSSGTRVGSALMLPDGFIGGVGANGQAGAVRLAPGAVASASVEAAQQPISGGARTSAPTGQKGTAKTTTTVTHPCATITSLHVAVPGSPSTDNLGAQLTDCYAFMVHPFVSGATGSLA